MRDIINISLPCSMTALVKQQVIKGNYASTSEFFRDLLRQRIEEEHLYRDIIQSEREFVQGKGKILHSLKDLH